MSSKTILVTGGTGFIGSRLCLRLRDQGHRVISLDNYFAGSKENHIEGVEYREGHTKDIATLVPEAPDLIFHLGEYARVEQSMLEPDIVEDLNIAGTTGVIDFWRQHACKLVYAGSSTKFGNEGWKKDAVPYVRTKAENTVRIRRIGEGEGLPYAIAYFYNVYGPGERAGIYGTVIEAFKQMYLKGEPLAVTSPGTQKRNFTHVDDIVDGLLLIAENGQGDEYGLGSDRSFTILEVAKLFGGEIIMLPERMGNRMSSDIDTGKARALGWRTSRDLESYIRDFTARCRRGKPHERRILVFSTTFFPVAGPAEEALMELVRDMPDLTFDIVTTSFTRSKSWTPPVPNLVVHHVGIGGRIDKFLLPVLGALKAWRLSRTHEYLFLWSIMASYAALAAILFRRVRSLPLLITLADQRLSGLSRTTRFMLGRILSDADQVYGTDTRQEALAAETSRTVLPRSSLGQGDAFANQLRYAYADRLRTQK